jgi:hypothetical protein
MALQEIFSDDLSYANIPFYPLILIPKLPGFSDGFIGFDASAQ